MGITWGDLEALLEAKGLGKLPRVILMDWGVNVSVRTRFFVATAAACCCLDWVEAVGVTAVWDYFSTSGAGVSVLEVLG